MALSRVDFTNLTWKTSICSKSQDDLKKENQFFIEKKSEVLSKKLPSFIFTTTMQERFENCYIISYQYEVVNKHNQQYHTSEPTYNINKATC